MHSRIRVQHPSYLAELIEHWSSTRCLWSNDDHRSLHVQRTSNCLAERAFGSLEPGSLPS